MAINLAARRHVVMVGLATALVFSAPQVFAQSTTTGPYSDEASEYAKYNGVPGNLPSLAPVQSEELK